MFLTNGIELLWLLLLILEGRSILVRLGLELLRWHERSGLRLLLLWRVVGLVDRNGHILVSFILDDRGHNIGICWCQGSLFLDGSSGSCRMSGRPIVYIWCSTSSLARKPKFVPRGRLRWGLRTLAVVSITIVVVAVVAIVVVAIVVVAGVVVTVVVVVAAISLIVARVEAIDSVDGGCLSDESIELGEFPEDVDIGLCEVDHTERGPPMRGTYRGIDAVPELSVAGACSSWRFGANPVRKYIVCRTHDFGFFFGETVGGDPKKEVCGCLVRFGA